MQGHEPMHYNQSSAGSDESELELTNTKPNANHKRDIRASKYSTNKYQAMIQSTPSSYDSVDPLNIVKTAIKVGYKKAESTSLKSFGGGRIIMKSMMSGAYLAFTITLSLYATSVGWDKASAGILFPMGFVMLILMGNDLATGN